MLRRGHDGSGITRRAPECPRKALNARLPRVRVTLAFLMALVASAGGQADALQIEMHGSRTCPTRAALDTAVGRQSAGIPHADDARLAVWRTKRAVNVVFRAHNMTRRRSIEIEGPQCSEVVETISFLVRSWLSELPSVPLATARLPARVRHATSEPPRRSPRQTTLERPKPKSTDSAPAGAAAIAESAQAAPPEAPAVPVAPNPPEPEQPPPPPEPPKPAAVAPREAELPPVASAAPWRWLALLSAGGHLSPDRHGGAQATAAMELAKGRWHVIAEGSWLTRLDAPLSVGSISIDRTALSVLAGFSVVEGDRWGVDALAGARGEHWVASSQGFSTAKTTTLWVPGAMLGARARLALGQRFVLSASVQGRFVATPSFEVTHVEGDVTPSFSWLSADVGLGFQIW